VLGQQQKTGEVTKGHPSFFTGQMIDSSPTSRPPESVETTSIQKVCQATSRSGTSIDKWKTIPWALPWERQPLRQQTRSQHKDAS